MLQQLPGCTCDWASRSRCRPHRMQVALSHRCRCHRWTAAASPGRAACRRACTTVAAAAAAGSMAGRSSPSTRPAPPAWRSCRTRARSRRCTTPATTAPGRWAFAPVHHAAFVCYAQTRLAQHGSGLSGEASLGGRRQPHALHHIICHGLIAGCILSMHCGLSSSRNGAQMTRRNPRHMQERVRPPSITEHWPAIQRRQPLPRGRAGRQAPRAAPPGPFPRRRRRRRPRR